MTVVQVELARLQASIEETLHRAGALVSDAEIASIADVVLADAIRISLLWLEGGQEAFYGQSSVHHATSP